MSVTIDWPTPDTPLTAADGSLTIIVRGSGPRRAAVFVNEAVVETGDDGTFEAEVSLTSDDAWLVAGMLTGCACVTQRVPIRVSQGCQPA